MEIRLKKRMSIISLVNKIDDASFDETHIKQLLIEIRELVDKNSFTRELGDFIAHDERSQGDCRMEMAFRAVCQNNYFLNHNYPKNGILVKSINILLIDKNKYEIVFEYGLNSVSDGKLLSSIGLTKKQTRKFIADNYFFDKKNKVYSIANIDSIKTINIVFNIITGVVDASPLVTTSEIIKTLDKDVAKIYKYFIKECKYNSCIASNENDVSVCIMSLLQDVRFTLFDDCEGVFKLSQGFEYNGFNERREMISTADLSGDYASVMKMVEKEFGLCVYGHVSFLTQRGKMHVATKYVESVININKYSSNEWAVKFLAHDIPGIYTVRDEMGSLRVCAY